MNKKESDGKLYRIYKDEDSHINTKVNNEGRISALQFKDENNALNGPVELEEVSTDEILSSKTPTELNPYVQYFIGVIFAPAISYVLEKGTDKFLSYLSNKLIPSAKQHISNFVNDKKIYCEVIKDGLRGKETKASRLLRESEEKNSTDLTEKTPSNQNINAEFYSSEDIQNTIDTLKKSIIVVAACIRKLTNAIVIDDGTDLKKSEEYKEQLEKLATTEVMMQINLMLEDKNRSLLDENTYQILKAFSKGNFIVDGTAVPIAQYIDFSNENKNTNNNNL